MGTSACTSCLSVESLVVHIALKGLHTIICVVEPIYIACGTTSDNGFGAPPGGLRPHFTPRIDQILEKLPVKAHGVGTSVHNRHARKGTRVHYKHVILIFSPPFSPSPSWILQLDFQCLVTYGKIGYTPGSFNIYWPYNIGYLPSNWTGLSTKLPGTNPRNMTNCKKTGYEVGWYGKPKKNTPTEGQNMIRDRRRFFDRSQKLYGKLFWELKLRGVYVLSRTRGF